MSTTTTLFGAAEAQAARTLIGGTAIGDLRNELLKQILVATANKVGGSSSVAFADITGSPSDNAALAAALDAKLDKAGGTMTGALINSTNGAVSAPVVSLTGTVFTGGSATTTKPLFLLEPAGTTSNNWDTDGTMLGVNAASGFAGDLCKMQVNSVRMFAVDNLGSLAFGGANDLGCGQSSFGFLTLRSANQVGAAIWGAGGMVLASNRSIFWTDGDVDGTRDTSLARTAAGEISANGSLKTAAPTTGTAAAWKFGSIVTAAVSVDLTQYVELDVGGVLVKLIKAS